MEHAAVRVSLANLRTFPCVRELEARGKLRLRGAFFAIADGVLHLLDERTGRFNPA
jgi:carbonic anhydrase